jgi:hypothetical protein
MILWEKETSKFNLPHSNTLLNSLIQIRLQPHLMNFIATGTNVASNSPY